MFPISSLTFLLIFCGAILPTRLSVKCKAGAGGAVALVAYRWQISRCFFGGHVLTPQLPGFWVDILAFIGAVSMFFATLMPLIILINAVWYFHDKRVGKTDSRRRKTITITNLILLCAYVILTAVGFIGASQPPRVRKFTVEIPNLPAAAEGKKLLFISDLHIDHTCSDQWVRDLVNQANSLAPDVVLLGGDLTDGTVAQLGEKIALLRQMRAPDGIFMVSGNHEYYSDFAGWREFYRSIRLDNQVVTLPWGVALAGIPDEIAKKYPGATPPDLNRVLNSLPPNRPVILLSHRPNVAWQADGKVALQLSGHTHGGMIWGVSYLVARFNRGFVSGRYRLPRGLELLVCNGTGIWRGFPIRVGCPPEILLIELRLR